MVNADLLDAIDRSLRQARQRPHEAFGGVQLVLFGDPYQLAPVPGDPEERAYFADRYASMWFFDARVWDEADLTIYELGTIHRQHELEFKQLLTAVRHGEVTPEMGQRLNQVGARPPPDGGRDHPRHHERHGHPHQRQRAGASCPAAALTAMAEVSGEFGGRAFPADERLELKVGAQVMFLRNDTGGDGRWVNGTIGEVVKIADTVTVEVDGERHEVLPSTWERYRYSYSAATKTLQQRCRGRVHPVPAAAGVGGHHPQVAGQELRPGDRRPRPAVVRARPDLRRALAHHGARGALPDPAAAAERRHRGRRGAPVHEPCDRDPRASRRADQRFRPSRRPPSAARQRGPRTARC